MATMPEVRLTKIEGVEFMLVTNVTDAYCFLKRLQPVSPEWGKRWMDWETVWISRPPSIYKDEQIATPTPDEKRLIELALAELKPAYLPAV